MTVHRHHLRALWSILRGWLERASKGVIRSARKRSAPSEIAFSTDPAGVDLGAYGLMQMLDAMPSWTFNSKHRAFTTRTAAAAPSERTVVTRGELNELVEALKRVRPGPFRLRVMGLPWSQTDQLKPYLRLAEGGELTSCDAPQEPLSI